MAIEELDELVNLFDAEDRAAVTQALERSPVARARVQSQQALYKAFVESDSDAAAELSRQQAASNSGGNGTGAGMGAGTTTQNATTSPSFDLNQIETLITERLKPVTSRLDADLSEDRLEKVVTKIAEKLTPALLNQATANADALYLIRTSHREEFGKELDRPAFEKFVSEHPGKFANWTDAHDAYVQEERINVRIAKGIAEGRLNAASNDVPGSSLPNSHSPLTPIGSFIRSNPLNKTANGEARGEQLDAATKAFRALRSQAATD